jgi:hypothetical protein
MCSIVLALYDVLVYTGRATFFGARERKNELLGQSPSPELTKKLIS